jgi:hypothetical protein
MRLASNGNLGIGTTVAPYEITVSTDGSIPTLYTTTLSTLDSSSNINVSGKSLSNINATKTSSLEVSTITSLASEINVSGKSLSNITTARASTVEVTNLTTTNSSVINVSGNSLSNINAVSIQTIKSDTSVVDVTGTSLCNIVTTATTNLVATNVTSPTSTLNMSGNTLSNVNTLIVNNITTLGASSTINVSGKSLSNINTVDTAALTASTSGGVINASGTTLSNITTTKTVTLEATNLTTTNSGVINVSGNTLSNISTASLATITTDAVSKNINVSQKNFSNLDTIDVRAVTASTSGGIINMSGTTLSNIATAKTSTLEVSTVTTVAPSSVITYTSGITLSNLDTVKTTNAQISALTGGLANNTINASATTFSNVQNISVNDTVYTNSVSTLSGSNIDFNNKNITNVDNLYVNSSFNVAGEFIVTNMITSNANRFVIDNDGVGPALSVNQQQGFGDGTVAAFTSDSNLAMGINAKRQVAIGGDFGSNMPATLPYDAQVYVEANDNDSQDALYVKQNSTTFNIAKLEGGGAGASNVVVDTFGRVGFGTTPTARIHAYHNDTATNEFIHLATSSNANALVVGADGRVAMGTSISTKPNSTLTVANFVETPGFIAPGSSTELDFNAMDASNVNVLKTALGSAAAPAVTFNDDTSTGIFHPSATNTLAFSTAGTERVRVLADGKVGINTDAPLVQFQVNSSDAIRIPVGSNADRPAGVDGYIRYNSELSIFEGYGPGGAWGSLGGSALKDVAGTTTITTELTPGAGDCNISFITAGTETMRLAANGNLGIGTTVAPYNLTVASNGSIPTLYTSNLSTLNSSSNIDVSGKNLSNINTVDIQKITASVSGGKIDLSGVELSNVGPILAEDGSEAAPAYSFMSDPSTGMYHPAAANTLALVTAGSERIRVLADGKVGINTDTPLVQFQVDGTDAIRVPVGSNADRPSGVEGYIRYNSEISSFEGYGPGGAWGSLGGVKDVAQTTFISAEEYPGRHDCNIRFVTAGTETMRLASNGHLGIGTTVAPYDITVATDGSIPTLYTSTLTTLDSSSNINVSGKTLSNINYTVSTVVDTSQLLSRANNNTILATNITLSNLSTVDTATITANSTGGVINMSATTLSNVAVAQVGQLSSLVPNDYIDCTNTSFCNIDNLQTASLSHPSGVIDTLTTSLCNIFRVDVNNKVTTPAIGSLTNNLSMSWNRVLDVDSIVVRSNMTILMPGLNTISNLPSDVVRLDAGTGKILDDYISSNLVRLMGNGQLNPALIPGLSTSDRASFVRSMDKVGIGLRNPAQRLHVNGNQVITGGRLGVGTTVPMSSVHVYDDNASVGQSVKIESVGSTDIIGIFGGCNAAAYPAFYINAACNVGIGTTAPMYSLDCAGEGRINNLRTSSIIAENGTIDCQLTAFSNVFSMDTKFATVSNLVVTDFLSVPTTVSITTGYFVKTQSTTTETNYITSLNSNVGMNVALNISGYDASLYPADPNLTTRIGLKVNEYILSKATLTISDKRTKSNIIDASSDGDLQAVLDIPVKRFTYIDDPTNTVAGFIAQDVEKSAPYAVRTITSAIPDIMETCSVSTPTTITLPSDSKVVADKKVKVLIGGQEITNTIVSVDNGIATLEDALPEGTESVLVYGTIVSDFKVLESERLIPLAFNAIKELNTKLTMQQTVIDDILKRLSVLEQK